MRITILLIALVASAGCFDPTFREDLRCGAGGECPAGLFCGTDNVCRATPAIPDAEVPDALVIPDANPVACTGDPDCLTPPNPCLTAGVCDLEAGVCDFGEVDCSGLDGECNIGMCEPATGTCIAVGANENDVCGAGIVCGTFSACAGFSGGTCDSTGEQTRTCTRNACNNGACVAETPFMETAGCTRVTENVDCMTDTVTGCGTCGSFSSTCDEGGSQTCTCTDFKCQSDACMPVATSCSQSCNRDTDGVTCGSVTESGCSGCTYSDICDETAPAETCTCTTPVCVAGGCTGSTSASCTNSCARNTDGDECACVACGSTGNFRSRPCLNGTCTGVLQACGSC